MKYNQPYDQPLSPNAGYIDGNPGAGIAGSIPPAAMMEYPQREVVAVIAASGQAPDNGDLQQLLKAVRGDVLGFYADAGTPNAILVNPLPAYLGQPGNGTRFRVRLANPVTGGATFQVNTNTPLPMVKSGGAALTGGEGFQAGDVVSVTVDGGYAKVSAAGGSGSNLIPTGNVVLTVPGQYPTIRAAVIAASMIFLPVNVFGVIQVAAGYVENLSVVTGPVQLPGQFGERWTITAPALNGAFPSKAEILGKSNAQALALLRTRFQVEVRCIGTSAFEIRSGVWSGLVNILVSGDQTNNGGHYGIKAGDWSSRVGLAALGLANVWVHGFGLANIRAEQSSVIQCNNVGSTYSSAHNFHASHYSVIEVCAGNILGMYGQVGIMLQNAGQLACDNPSGQNDFCNNLLQGIGSPDYGIVNAYNATAMGLTGNGTYGINMQLNSVVALPSNGATLFGSNASGDIAVSFFTTVATYGCGLPGGSSPGRGSGFGNANAIVV